MNTQIDSIDNIRKSGHIGVMVSHSGKEGCEHRILLQGNTEDGTLWSWCLDTESAMEVVETALTEWGWTEVSSPVVQSQLYHALLLERENQLNLLLDEIPFH